MRVSRLRADVVDDPAYAVFPPDRSRAGGAWRAVFMSLAMALVVAALVIYAPTTAAAGARVPAPIERLAD